MYIRDYERKDLEIIVTLYNDTINKYVLKGLSEEQKKAIILSKDPNIYHQFLFKPNPTIILEDKGQIMGFSMIKVETESVGFLNFLFVEKDNLNNGYGKKLLSSIERKAKQINLKKIYLYSTEHATKKKFYEKQGYTTLGLETHKIENIPFREVRMEKEI